MKSSVLAPLLLVTSLLHIHASPIRYDQRQDGDWNVDARLQNFFVVLAPSNSAQLSSSGISLLDFASKAGPLRLRPPAAAGDQDGLPPKQREEPDQPDKEVKEAKDKTGRSAGGFLLPRSALSDNAVPPVFTKEDILKSPLAKLHPELQVQVLRPPEEVLIARSPVVALKFPAVPMLVAVPVPEVAPEAPAPPALLPLQPLQPQLPLNEAAAPDPLSEKVEEAVAAAEVPAAPAASLVATAADNPQPEAAQPVASQPAVETNQVELEAAKKGDEALAEEPTKDLDVPKVHLIGTGIEDCGPERIRNQEGVCVDAAERD